MRIQHLKYLLLLLLSLTIHLSASAVETDKDYILLLNSINRDEAWTKSFDTELRHLIGKQDMELKDFFLSVPLLKDEEEVRLLQEKILQTFPHPPKVVVVIGDPGWMVSAPLFDGPWKDIPVVLCYSRNKVPADLQTLLAKSILTAENSIPIKEFNKKYNVTVLEQPYYISETLNLMKQLQPDIKQVAFISDHRYISIVTRQAIEETMQAEFPAMNLELLSSDAMTTEQLLDIFPKRLRIFRTKSRITQNKRRAARKPRSMEKVFLPLSPITSFIFARSISRQGKERRKPAMQPNAAKRAYLAR